MYVYFYLCIYVFITTTTLHASLILGAPYFYPGQHVALYLISVQYREVKGHSHSDLCPAIMTCWCGKEDAE